MLYFLANANIFVLFIWFSIYCIQRLGNKAFAAKEYDDAIKHYTGEREIYSDIPV